MQGRIHRHRRIRSRGDLPTENGLREGRIPAMSAAAKADTAGMNTAPIHAVRIIIPVIRITADASTRSERGIREIPMTPEVEVAFRTIIENRKKPKVEPMVDGYSGFLYLDKNDMPMVALHWEKYFQHILQKYNNIYRVQMPKVTPHVCRHTFCSNMAKSGMNPKSLQYIMGHSDISVTLNTYTHVKFEDAQEEMRKIQAV